MAKAADGHNNPHALPSNADVEFPLTVFDEGDSLLLGDLPSLRRIAPDVRNPLMRIFGGTAGARGGALLPPLSPPRRPRLTAAGSLPSSGVGGMPQTEALPDRHVV